MKGVVLWANPDRRPLARATNTNGGQLPANRFNVKAGSEAGFRNDHKKPPGPILPCIYLERIKRNTLQRSSFIHIPCGRIGPRGLASTSLCDPRIATMAYWPCSYSLLSLALILSYRFVAEVIRLVNPLCCNFFKNSAAISSKKRYEPRFDRDLKQVCALAYPDQISVCSRWWWVYPF